MKLKKGVEKLRSKVKGTIAEEIFRSNSVKDEIGLKNMRRLYYFSIIAMTVNLALISLFIPGLEAATEKELMWRMGIIGCHGILFFIMAVCCFFAITLLKKGKATSLVRVVSNTAILALLVGGVWLTAMDQLVTPNITPYILTCNIIALVFIIRPYYAAILYFISFGVFYYTAGIFQANQEILLSNRVNGLAAAGIGLCISVILWRAKAANVLYKRQIETQKKELEQKNLELEEVAFTDQLTNLYNRRSSDRIFQDEMALIGRYNHESCMIIVDLDHFKKINDHYGHPFGDRVLKEIAGLFINNIRETDKAIRWGGEEFLILLPNTKLYFAEMLAEQLRRIIEDNVIVIDNQEIRLTASFGVVVLNAFQENSLEMAYKNVDEALYLAKRKGRNRVETGIF